MRKANSATIRPSTPVFGNLFPQVSQLFGVSVGDGFAFVSREKSGVRPVRETHLHFCDGQLDAVLGNHVLLKMLDLGPDEIQDHEANPYASRSD